MVAAEAMFAPAAWVSRLEATIVVAETDAGVVAPKVPFITAPVSVLLVSVWVSVVPTAAPAGLPTPPAGNVIPTVPSTMVAMFKLLYSPDCWAMLPEPQLVTQQCQPPH